MIVTDLVYQQIREHLARHQPERGGALYGPKDYPIVTHFEYDFDARTTEVSYAPSPRLIANAPRVEQASGLRFKGIVHSHPRGMIQPSAGDEHTVQTFFIENPHVSSFALPIVQECSPSEEEAGKPFLHWYRAERRGSLPRSNMGFTTERRPAVAILNEQLHVIPLWAHARRLMDTLRAHGVDLVCEKKTQNLEIAGCLLVGLVCTSASQHEVMYFAGTGYPVTAPVVLYQEDGVTQSLVVDWDGMAEVETYVDRIAAKLSQTWLAAMSQSSAWKI